MEPLNTTSESFSTNSEPQASIPATRKRLTRIKATPQSFRLGQDSVTPPTVASSTHREFRFNVPSAAELGNLEEATRILEIASSLSASGIGHVAKLAISDSVWEIHFQLPLVAHVADEERYLTETSQQLAPTVNQLPNLKTGFQRGKGSTWKYCINDFVAAEGSL